MKKFITLIVFMSFSFVFVSCEKEESINSVSDNMETLNSKPTIEIQMKLGHKCFWLIGEGCLVTITINPLVKYEDLPSDVVISDSYYKNMIGEGYELALIKSDKWEKESFELPNTLISTDKKTNKSIEIPQQELNYSKESSAFVGFIKQANFKYSINSSDKKVYEFNLGKYCLIFGDGCRVKIEVEESYVKYQDLPSDVVISDSYYKNMIGEGYELALIKSDKWEKESFELPQIITSIDSKLDIPQQKLNYSKEANSFVGFIKKKELKYSTNSSDKPFVWVADFGTFCFLPGNGCSVTITINLSIVYQDLPSDVVISDSYYKHMIGEGYELALIKSDKWEKESFELPNTMVSNKKGEFPQQKLNYSKEANSFVGFIKRYK